MGKKVLKCPGKRPTSRAGTVTDCFRGFRGETVNESSAVSLAAQDSLLSVTWRCLDHVTLTL